MIQDRVRITRALISVSDKSGVVELASALQTHGVEILSSGGTAGVLEEAGIAVTRVADVTGFPELLDGRVKTLHPKIFAPILARKTDEHAAQMRDHQLPLIDLVVVNLYPFERTVRRSDATVAEIIEQIDIGGPSLVRAAAKNHERVAVVVDPSRYDALVTALQENGEVPASLRRELAAEAFAHTAAYDAAISNYFEAARAEAEGLASAEVRTVQLRRAQLLRYGENPHQSAAYYRPSHAPEPAYEQLQGKELSFNNFVDVDAAWQLVSELPDTAVAIIKHTNPCGAASVNGTLVSAYKRALAGDPVSAFGGIVACNRAVDADTAEAIRGVFTEVVVAPAFSAEAREILRKKKSLRLIIADATSSEWRADGALSCEQWSSAFGGMLIQQVDGVVEPVAEGRMVTAKQPDADQLADLQFAWIVAKHVKSNAIVFARNRQAIGVGAGQMSRVDAVDLAARRSRLALEGSVVASDAFFPFRDGLDRLASVGAQSVVQPGGSKRDEEVIAAANEHGIAMVFTGRRHFRH